MRGLFNHRKGIRISVINVSLLILSWVIPGEIMALPLAPHYDRIAIEGDFRLRWDHFSGEDLNDKVRNALGTASASSEKDDWILTRLRLRLTIHPNNYLRIFTELSDARVNGDDSHPSDFPGTRRNWEQDRLDLYQGYIDFKLFGGSHFIVGRQLLAFGSQLLLSHNDWWNTPYTFDALRLSIRHEVTTIDFFIGQNVINDDKNFNTVDDAYSGLPARRFLGTFDDYTVYGAYLTQEINSGHAFDFYAILADNSNEQTHITTFGSRWHGIYQQHWDYDLEVIFQPGNEYRGLDHRAWSAAVECGRSFPTIMFQPRWFCGYDYASGDKNPLDASNQAFIALYPDNYSQLGHQEFFNRQNLHAFHTGIETLIAKKITTTINVRGYWVDQDDDGWGGYYNSFRAAKKGQNADNHIGTALEFKVECPWHILDYKLVTAIMYNHFFAGDFVADTQVNQVADDADELILMMQFNF